MADISKPVFHSYQDAYGPFDPYPVFMVDRVKSPVILEALEAAGLHVPEFPSYTDWLMQHPR